MRAEVPLMQPPAELLAQNHPLLSLVTQALAVLYALALISAMIAPRAGRVVLAGAALIHLGVSCVRGWLIAFFPLTNKMESFSAAALALAAVTLVVWRPARAFLLPLLLLVVAAMAGALTFSLDLRFPPPLMRTVWYPTHVPLSFLAYGAWAAAAAAALAWLVERDDRWLERIDRLALWGFGLWSVSMICGGIWGVLAWGAYFLWDPKVVWSVILWFHYAVFIHLRLTPSLQRRRWVRPALALLGLLWVLVTYVGTSFLFGGSSHAF